MYQGKSFSRRQLMVIGSLPDHVHGHHDLRLAIRGGDGAQIECLDHINREANQTVFRKPVMQSGRQQQTLVQIVSAETLSHEQHF